MLYPLSYGGVAASRLRAALSRLLTRASWFLRPPPDLATPIRVPITGVIRDEPGLARELNQPPAAGLAVGYVA